MAGSYYDQAVRSGELAGATLAKVTKHLDKAEQLDGQASPAAVKAQLANAIKVLDPSGDQGELREALAALRASL